MSRNTTFRNGREPLSSNQALRLHSATGPVPFLNPTIAHYTHVGTTLHELKDGDEPPPPAYSRHDSQPAADIGYKWTARNNRKGRHQLIIEPATAAEQTTYACPQPTDSFRHIWTVLCRMLIRYPVWDISWLSSYVFAWGSLVWLINGFFVFLPEVKHQNETEVVILGGGISAFLAATIFEFGAILMMLEAVNENRNGCFGWAIRKLYEQRNSSEKAQQQLEHMEEMDIPESASIPPPTPIVTDLEQEQKPLWRVEPDLGDGCEHHHRNRRNLVGKAKSDEKPVNPDNAAEGSSQQQGEEKDDAAKDGPTWVWVPSLDDLRHHYFLEIGFIATLAQLFGATFLWISGVTALPGIQEKLSIPVLNWLYWSPQVIGGCGFIIAALLFMIESQKQWWRPAPDVLGWHIALWNLIGGIGFTLSPAFGYNTIYWAQYQSVCSTFWGSVCFLIGSLFQLYESLEKNPVEIEPTKRQDQDPPPYVHQQRSQ